MEQLKGNLITCFKCQENGKGDGNSETWIDGRCVVCNPKPPSTDVILGLTFKRIKSMNNHLTFYTIVMIINLIGILLLIFGTIQL